MQWYDVQSGDRSSHPYQIFQEALICNSGSIPSGVLVAVVAFLVFSKNVDEIDVKWQDLLQISWLDLSLLVGAVQMLSFALQGDTEYGWDSHVVFGNAIGQPCAWLRSSPGCDI